jgi:hypothetical protein
MKFKINIFHVLITILIGLIISANSCKKLIAIPPPVNTITIGQVFADSADANAAILGIYSSMLQNTGAFYFMNGAISIITGSSADELIPFGVDANKTQIYINLIQLQNNDLYNFYWTPAYQLIYQTNACIAGLQASTTLSSTTKSQLIAEAKFLRAYYYFYLTNLFENVPYINSIEYTQTSLATNTSQTIIYQQIVSDLLFAQSNLRSDYSLSGGQKIRANKWAATAMLARVYLFTKDYTDAIKQAASIINSGAFGLVNDPNGIFLANSNEAILQWGLNPGGTNEGDLIIPQDSTSFPSYYLSPQLLKAFELNDKRKADWIDSTNYSGTIYYYPYKYKNGPSQNQPGAAATEYYMVLRLAEQFLIRAEAECNQNELTEAIADVNLIP